MQPKCNYLRLPICITVSMDNNANRLTAKSSGFAGMQWTHVPRAMHTVPYPTQSDL